MGYSLFDIFKEILKWRILESNNIALKYVYIAKGFKILYFKNKFVFSKRYKNLYFIKIIK